MSELSRFDVVVIGSGPGGEGAAMKCVKQGKSVAVIERYASIGGGCTHWGTIPSKALRRAIFRVVEARQDPILRKMCRLGSISFRDLMAQTQSVINQQVNLRQGFYERNGVPIISGHARFVDPHTVEVIQSDRSPVQLQAEHFVLALQLVSERALFKIKPFMLFLACSNARFAGLNPGCHENKAL